MPDELPPSATPTPIPPVSEPVAPVPSGLDPHVAAGIAVIFTILSGIIMLVVEKRDNFVRFWAMQAIFLGVAAFVFAVASAMVGMILGMIFGPLAWLWYILSGVVKLGFVAVWVISMIKAFSGQEWEIPALGKLARQQLAKTALPRP